MAGMVLLCAAIVLGLFAKSVVIRASRMVRARTMIPFVLGSDYQRYFESLFQHEAVEAVLSAQRATARGQVLLTWISLPFHLDFTRNPIVSMDSPGARRLSLELGQGADAEDLRRHLQAQGVRYVMWQYEGQAVRRGPEYGPTFGLFRSLALRSEAVHRDNRVVVFDLAAQRKRVPGASR